MSFGEYIEEIARGSYGEVYLSDRHLAVKKFIHPTVFINPDTLVEIVCLKSLQPHPNIIQLVGVDYQPSATYMAMELAIGTLDSLIRQKNFDFQDIALQIVQAVAHCHRFDIIHRDIKPDNFLLFPNHRLKLADFGLAKVNTCSSYDLIGYAYVAEFRAPEVSLNIPYSEPADVWAIACLFLEIKNGESPFWSNYIDRESILKSIFRELGSPLPFYTDPSQEYRFWPRVEQSPVWESVYEKFPTTTFFDQFPPLFGDLIRRMLYFNPKTRLDIFGVLEHPFFGQNPNRVPCGQRNLDRILPNPRHSVNLTPIIDRFYELTKGLPWKVCYDAIFYLDTWIAHRGNVEVEPMADVCYNVACKLQGVRQITPLIPVDFLEIDLWEMEKELLELMDYNLILVNAYDLIVKAEGQSWAMLKAVRRLEEQYPRNRFLDPQLVARQCIDFAHNEN